MRLDPIWSLSPFAILAILLPITGVASESTEPSSTPERLTQSLQIKFTRIEIASKARDRLHREIGSALVYRSRHLPYDVVRVADSSTGANSPDPKKLEAVCDRYRRSKLVIECRLDRLPRVHFPESTHTSLSSLLEETSESASALPPPSEQQMVSCPLTENYGEPSLMRGNLSAFWGHDFVGADFSRSLMEIHRSKLHPATIATWEEVNLLEFEPDLLDSELLTRRFAMGNRTQQKPVTPDRHGTAVLGVIAGPAPYGVAGSAKLVAEGGSTTGGKEISSTERAIAKKAAIFQVSTSSDNPDVFKMLSDAGVISVRSAGNLYPSPKVDQAAPEQSIIVGQLSPLGGMDATSSSYPEVTLVAPGEIPSQPVASRRTRLDGTSGAQALVTGCLANAVSVLQGLTPNEAKEILVRTAVPTLNARAEPRTNGAGTLNCYRMLRVALRLADDWPRSRGRITEDPTLVDFSDEAGKYFETASKMKEESGGCTMRAKLDLLRKSFLLDPTRPGPRTSIARIYSEQGLTGNSRLYDSLGELDDEKLSMLFDEVRGTPYETDMIRFSGENGAGGGILLSALHSENIEQVFLAAGYARKGRDRANTAAALLKVFESEKITAHNIDEFLALYFDRHAFPSYDLFNACKEKMSDWSHKRAHGLDTVCFKVLDRDPKVARWFIWNQIRNGTSEIIRAMISHYSSHTPPDYALDVLRQEKKHSRWTQAQRAVLDRLVPSTDG